LIAQECRPVQELAELVPIRSWLDAEGRTIFDFGQNIGGYVAFVGMGEAGARVLLEHAEFLDKDGNFYNVNYRSAEAIIDYTFAGGAVEDYRPTFTFLGFRYARATVEGGVRLDTIVAVPITSVPHAAASFSSA